MRGGENIVKENFKAHRIRAGLTQQNVADALGISQVSVCQWENGDALPKADKLVTIAALYGCTVEDLLKGDETA